jgi:hypothetical protein
MKKIDLSNPTDKQLKTGYLNYNTSMVVQLLQNFCKSPEGANAGVMLVLPDGRSPMQKEFNIKEIKLVENKLINAAEKCTDPRCAIPETLSRLRDPGACGLWLECL